MSKKSYGELLRDPRWQRKRLEILNRADFSCETCGDTESTLNVHHKIYRRGAKPWEYTDAELTALCEPCHLEHHSARDRLNVELAGMDTSMLERVLGYAMALRLDAETFNDLPEDQQPPRRFVELQCDSEAFGFADCAQIPREHERCDKLRELGPIGHSEYFGLAVYGLPQNRKSQ